MNNMATIPPPPGWRPVNEEAPLLDERLGIFVRGRLTAWNCKQLNGEDEGDIRNTSWEKSLPQPIFHASCTHARIQYLRTTADRHMSNLIRSERQRSNGLKAAWDKVLLNRTAVRAEDVWDHIATILGRGGDDQGVAHRHMPRMFPGFSSRIPTDTEVRVYAFRALAYLWGDEYPYSACRHHCWCPTCSGHRCSLTAPHHWRDSSCEHPVCAAMRLFENLNGQVNTSEALQEAAKFVHAQVSLRVAQSQGDPHDRDSGCCRCCRRHCCHH